MVLIATMSCSTNPMSSGEPEDEFWFRHPELKDYAKQRMEQAKLKLHTIQDVKVLQRQFQPITEIVDFEPTAEIVFARDLVGNCKSASVLGQWSLAQIGIPSRLVDLYGNNVSSHRICVSDDNEYMITNCEVCELDPEYWQKQVMSLFGWKYNRIEE
jgi:hypothetical protein